jgi:hypothetical protein
MIAAVEAPSVGIPLGELAGPGEPLLGWGGWGGWGAVPSQAAQGLGRVGAVSEDIGNLIADSVADGPDRPPTLTSGQGLR